ncbi:MAG: hypothetical protein A3F90_18460 [Deltaproteobacteria bacterium RIFCSPLOWO2_12_FULL_60_19]|nr:MAG: hypothetical protein A3F90_18460 [Deltaproteobacteria bacterium RIFCSPLOWO2_12_FULL_60_19]
MSCPSCHAELAGEPKYCSECGYNLKSESPGTSPASGSEAAPQQDLAAGGAEGAMRRPSGFSRTLSTELVSRQNELRTAVKLSTLIQSRNFHPGEVMIRQGETKRDLFFLTDGVVEISRKDGDADLVLNEIEAPYILGDVAFLFGMPRTATAKAKTDVTAFVLKQEDISELLKDLPAWVHPLLTSLASGIKSLHHKSGTLEKRLLEVEGDNRHRS